MQPVNVDYVYQEQQEAALALGNAVRRQQQREKTKQLRDEMAFDFDETPETATTARRSTRKSIGVTKSPRGHVYLDDPKRKPKSFGAKLHFFLFDNKTFFVLAVDHPFRTAMIRLVRNPVFDRCILVLILANCVFLAMGDPLCIGHGPGIEHTPCAHEPLCSMAVLDTLPCGTFCQAWTSTREGHTCSQSREELFQVSELVFTSLFSIECILKVLARGFVLHQGAYLRDGWNAIDFVVVVMGWLAYIPGVGNFSALRTIRVLRPLRTMSRIPGMRPLIKALLASVKPLFDVLLLFGFVFFLFGIIGVQLLTGTLRGRCYVNVDGVWEREEEDPDSLCAYEASGRQCPTGSCLTHDPVTFLPNPNPSAFQEFISFDHIGWAFLTIFQCITLEGWTDIMYLLEDGYNPWGARLYFVLLVIVGSWFVINLALAVISDNFNQSVNEETVLASQKEPTTARSQTGEHANTLAAFEETRATGRKTLRFLDTASRWCRRLVEHKVFSSGIMALILLNTVSLAVESHDQCLFQEHYLALYNSPDYEIYSCSFLEDDPLCGALVHVGTTNVVEITGMDTDLDNALEDLNLFFTVVFTLELVLKLVGLGPREYAASSFNLFDAVVVAASLVEIFYSAATSGETSGVISVFRAARLFRVFKLARSWTSLRHILQTLQQSLRSIAPLTIVLVVFVFIFSLLGMQLFGGNFLVDGENPRANFDSFLPTPGPQGGYGAAFTIFQILTGENWNEIMYNGMAAGSDFAFVYFLFVVVLGIFIIMNLFLAILLQGFSAEDPDAEEEEEAQPSVSLWQRFFACVRRKRVAPAQPHTAAPSATAAAAAGDQHAPHSSNGSHTPEDSGVGDMAHPGRVSPGSAYTAATSNAVVAPPPPKTSIWDRSLFVLAPSSPLRRLLLTIVKNRYFESFVLVCIVVSSVLMAFENPAAPDTDPFVRVMAVLDLVMVCIFTLEMVLKIVAFGFILGDGAYLSDNWNILDFLIVIVSLLSISLTAVRSLRTLRAFRALRPLRIINRNPGMKIAVNCLLKSIPSMFNVLLVCLLFFFIFAILGLQMFKGKYWLCVESAHDVPVDACDTTALSELPLTSFPRTNELMVVNNATGEKIRNWLECVAAGGEWVQVPQNFDNIFVTLLTLFEVSTLEGWLDVMDNGIDAPVQTGMVNRPMNFPSQILFFVLFVIVGAFFVLNVFIGVVIDNYNQLKMTANDSNVLVTSEQRQWLAALTVMVKSKPRKQPQVPTNALRRRLFVLVQSRAFEMSVMAAIMANIAVLAAKQFGQSEAATEAQDMANMVFTILFSCEATLKIVALSPAGFFRDRWNCFDFVVVVSSLIGLFEFAKGGTAVAILRVFRIARLFRLIRSAKGLRQLLTTLLFSLPSLANIGGLLFLVFCIYSILGVQFFYNVKQREWMDEHVNFQSFSSAFITLFRCTTGENWNAIMHECMSGVCAVCTPDMLDSGKCATGCGGAFVSFIYFFSFNMLCTFLVLNLFIAVILDNFNEIADAEEEDAISADSIDLFAQVWSQFDPMASNVINTSQLPAFLLLLPPPLGLGSKTRRADLMRFVGKLDLPDHGGKVVYQDVLLRLMFLRIPDDEALELKSYEEKMLLQKQSGSLQLAPNVCTVGQSHAASVLQRSLREFRERRREQHKLHSHGKTSPASDRSSMSGGGSRTLARSPTLAELTKNAASPVRDAGEAVLLGCGGSPDMMEEAGEAPQLGGDSSSTPTVPHDSPRSARGGASLGGGDDRSVLVAACVAGGGTADADGARAAEQSKS